MNTNPARGMRDFLPEDVRRRQYVIGVIADVYQRYGFEPLETPAVENIETLMGKYGEEGDRLIFRILKRGEEGKSGEADLALRYDLTVPLARVVAQYRAELPKFFKRYQVQPVWRADRPQKGRFREFYQCDVDAIGSTSPAVEVELCAAVADVFHLLGFHDFEIVINHRELLTALIRNALVPAEHVADAITAIDKLDKIGRDGVYKELLDRGIAEGPSSRIHNWLDAKWETNWAEWAIGEIPATDDVGRQAVDNLKGILDLAVHSSAAAHLKFQPTLARGLSYYTGAVFEVRVADLAGSLGGGGRYDNLLGMFSGEQIPAAGVSLGLERILVVMNERGMFQALETHSPADVMVTMWKFDAAIDDAGLQSHAIQLASHLRKAGLRVELFPDAGRDVTKQIKYAAGRGIPFATVVGARERETGRVGVRNLNTREQIDLSMDDLVVFLREAKLKAESRTPGATRG
jgi:histidyl-tRNA synthetase